MNEDAKLGMLITLRKDELELQARTFDQIDSKTGIALGFLLVAVGQVLSGFLSLTSKVPHVLSAAPCWLRWVACSGGFLALGALLSGAVSRWPTVFLYDIGTDLYGAPGEEENLLTQIHADYAKCVASNHSTLRREDFWATLTYTFTGLTLFIYIGLVLVASYQLGRG